MKTDYTLLRAIATFILVLLMLGGVMKAKGETFTQQEIVAITILAEARGEGKRGMYAVACVISKRMKERKRLAHKFACNLGSFHAGTKTIRKGHTCENCCAMSLRRMQ